MPSWQRRHCDLKSNLAAQLSASNLPYRNVKEKEIEGFNLTLQMIAERNIAVKEQLNRSAPKPED